jgi:RNA-directed DNA polymerase
MAAGGERFGSPAGTSDRRVARGVGLYLKPPDDLMERLDVPYVRYMDDWVILAKTRWALRRVVQEVNAILDNLRLEKHPDKTVIGRIDRGFDFLGYRFEADGLRLAAQTKQRFVERATRLYEQGAAPSRIGVYVRHWLTWVRAGGLVMGGKDGVSVWVRSQSGR